MWEEYVQVQLIFGIISVVVRVVVAGINVIGHHLLRTVYKGFQIANGFSIVILVFIKLFNLLQVCSYLICHFFVRHTLLEMENFRFQFNVAY